MTSKRQDMREALAELLVDGCPTAQAIFSYPAADFEQKSPVITVASSGTERPRDRFGNCTQLLVHLDVFIFVLYTDGDDWNEDDAENALDALEQEIAVVVKDNPGHLTAWSSLNYRDEQTEPFNVVIAGEEYRAERIPLIMRFIS